MTARERPRSGRRWVGAGIASAAWFWLAIPGGRRRPSAQRDVPEPAPAGGLPRRSGATVALSFAFVLVRDVRAERPIAHADGRLPPAWLRFPLRAIGLIGWIWIVAQGIAGGVSNAEVTTLFLWVYGWVGVAILSAFVGPVWQFLDPFSTLHDIGRPCSGGSASRLGHGRLPRRLGRWPAVIGFVSFVWLELVGNGDGPRGCSSCSSATRRSRWR